MPNMKGNSAYWAFAEQQQKIKAEEVAEVLEREMGGEFTGYFDSPIAEEYPPKWWMESQDE